MMKRIIGLLELALRRILVYPFLRLLLRNEQRILPLDISTITSVLILRYDKIGDMVVTLPVFRVMKARNPKLRIGVVTSEANLEILEGETAVDDRFVIYRNLFKLLREILRIRKERYDVVLNFIFNRTTSGGIIANIVCPHGVKIGQGAERYRFYFNALISLPRASIHMFDILIYYVEHVFGFKVSASEKHLLIARNDNARSKVDDFLKEHHLIRRVQKADDRTSYAILNISARESNKRMSVRQARFLANHLAHQLMITTLVISAPEDASTRVDIVTDTNSPRCFGFPTSGNASMHEITSLVEGAICVVTPDTAIIHVASATSTPVLGLFTPLQVNQEWLPYRTRYSMVLAPADCPVSDISLGTLQKEVGQFVGSLLEQDTPNTVR